MGMDIRLPIGLMFVVLGLLLTLYGVAGDRTVYDRHSLGININLWWGVVLLVFGGVMLLLGRRGSAAMRSAMASAEGRAIEDIERRTGKEDRGPQRH
jgi:hypothetical protein